MSRTILSWDVGIKNLAYCIVKFDENSFKIIKWDVINLLDDRLTCDHNLRGGSTKCGKIAKNVFTINEQESCEPQYYCKSHLTKIDYDIVIPLDVIKCCKCRQEAVKIVNNTQYGWCEKHLDKETGIYKRRCVRKINQQCTKQSLPKMGVSMFEKLDNVPEMMNVDEVIIENQPVLKNPTMKTVACLLLSYFIMRGIHEKKGKFNSETLRYVSASGKLKVNTKTSNNELKKGKNEKDVYNITKELGVKYTKAILNETDVDYLNKYKKQDDLCDAFLQAVRDYYGDAIPEDMATKLKLVDVESEKKSKVSKVSKVSKASKKNKVVSNDSDSDIEVESDIGTGMRPVVVTKKVKATKNK